MLRGLVEMAPHLMVTIIIFFAQSEFVSTEVAPVIVETQNPIMKGALIDDYSAAAIMIKLTAPSQMISDALSTIDKSKTPDHIWSDLQHQMGYLEKIYQKQFVDLLGSFQQMIATPYPQVIEGKSQKFDLTHLSRQKRNPFRLFMSFLKAIRPVMRVGGKLTKYGRFMKTLKYTGYIATGAFTYEMVDIFGGIPDRKYNELTQQLQELYDRRAEDLKIIDKVALVTMSLNDQISDITSEFRSLIGDVESLQEIKIRGSHLLTSYLNQLSFSLMILLNGKIPTFLMSLDLQKRWFESKMHSGLLLYISSISPHLKVELKAIDEEKHQFVLRTEIPVPDSRFQLLHYVPWEPKFWMEQKCYSSPAPHFYLAYPSSKSSDPIIKNPYLIDPRSCLADGFLMCESDSILNTIPGLKLNEICSALPIVNSRKKRSTDDEIDGPYYNLTGLIDRSLQLSSKKKNEETLFDIQQIRNEIRDLIELNKKQKEEMVVNLRDAEQEHRIYKTITIACISAIVIIMIISIGLIRNFLKNKSTMRSLNNELIHLKLQSS